MREFEKKISVIVPVCNAERYVARCIDSILSSPLEDIEVIAVDDGSLDRSLEILMMYKDPRLKVFSKRGEGAFRSWKYGVERASGEYIVFVDADDYVSPALFETAESLIRLRDYDLIQHGWMEVYERSARKTCGSLDIPQGEYLGEELRRVKDGYLFGGQGKQRMFPLALYGKVFRAELFCSLLPALLEDISAFADESICIPYLSKMQSLYFLSDHLYFRRKEERSVVNQARALVDATFSKGRCAERTTSLQSASSARKNSARSLRSTGAVFAGLFSKKSFFRLQGFLSREGTPFSEQGVRSPPSFREIESMRPCFARFFVRNRALFS